MAGMLKSVLNLKLFISSLCVSVAAKLLIIRDIDKLSVILVQFLIRPLLSMSVVSHREVGWRAGTTGFAGVLDGEADRRNKLRPRTLAARPVGSVNRKKHSLPERDRATEGDERGTGLPAGRGKREILSLLDVKVRLADGDDWVRGRIGREAAGEMDYARENCRHRRRGVKIAKTSSASYLIYYSSHSEILRYSTWKFCGVLVGSFAVTRLEILLLFTVQGDEDEN